MFIALLLVLAPPDLETGYEHATPPNNEGVVLLGALTDPSIVTPPASDGGAVPEGRPATDESFQQNLADTQTPANCVASPHRIPLTILTALVCGLLFLFFRQTE